MRRTTGAGLARKKRGGEGRGALRSELGPIGTLLRPNRYARMLRASLTVLALGGALFVGGAWLGWPADTLTSTTARAAGSEQTEGPEDMELETPDAGEEPSDQEPSDDGAVADGAVADGAVGAPPPGASKTNQPPESEAQEEATAPIVRSIRIRGNDQVPAEEIFEAIQATRVGEPFSKEKVVADFQAIYNLGYFTSDITADISPDGDGVSVIFQVHEFLVQDIEVSADEALTGLVDVEKVADSFSLQPGDVFDPDRLNQDLSGLTDFVWREFGVLVHPASPSVTQGGTVKVNLIPIRIRNIEVEGNEKTRDEVILREFSVESGSIVRMEQIAEDGRRVLQLGFFNEVVPRFQEVPADVAASGGAGNMIDLVIEVDERKTGSATFGAGWSSEGLIGQISIADDNFLGRGERVHLSAEFGESQTTYSLGFFEPYLDAQRTSFGFNLYSERDEYEEGGDEYRNRTTGGDVTLGRPWGEYTRAAVTLRIDGSEVTQLTGKDQGLVKDESGQTRSLTFSTNTDTSDHPYFPTTGYRTDFSVEFAGGILGGEHTFNKYRAEMVKYLRTGSHGQSLAFRVRGGMVTTPDETLSYQEEFKVGGADTVRGYEYGAADGTRMLVANAEYRFDITDGIQGVVFTDVGDAWKDLEPVPGWEEMMKSAGLGVRLDTPIGILRIDYGFGENGGKASFSLGPTF